MQERITTSKGTWIVSEMPHKIKYLSEWFQDLKEVSLWNFRKRIQLSKITEKEASEIVFRIGHHSNGHLIPSAVELLHSLLKSKGINDLTNKYIFKV